MPSRVYDLFMQAMVQRKQVLCLYNERERELCPVILGHSQGKEKALTYQFGGQSLSGLPEGGEWRCLWLDKVSDVRLRNGSWQTGGGHTRPQGCVDAVDLDINPASPYNPARRLSSRIRGHRHAKQGCPTRPAVRRRPASPGAPSS